MTSPPAAACLVTDEDLQRLLFIRRFEEKVLDLFAEGQASGTTHTCLGQEYIPVAISPLLEQQDFVLSNHRGHGHYLARYDDPEGLLAEIMGRSGAVCNGVGGSQHLYRPGFLSTGVQGESLAVGLGVALHFKKSGKQALVVAYIGDGTWGEGCVYEVLNMAQLWQVPLVVIVENNQIAQSTPASSHLAGTIAKRAESFGVFYHHVDDTDIGVIRAAVAPLLARTRATRLPLVIEFATVRLGPHSKGDDHRQPAEMARLIARDWHARYAEMIPSRFAAADALATSRVESVATDVRARTPSAWPREAW
jgi:acetoin:2,6-dichlorophenolindophenol oxidoreductase subunit alpha